MLTLTVIITIFAACLSIEAAARIPAHKQKWQYRYQVWLPAKWYRIARCETGVNWHHSNSQYISAFGISRQAYDEDARAMNAPPWNDARHPTPWNQYRAALGHYKLHGGFAGWGCRGA
jgi:hypothetical protein